MRFHGVLFWMQSPWMGEEEQSALEARGMDDSGLSRGEDRGAGGRLPSYLVGCDTQLWSR